MVAGQVDEALRLAERALELAREHRERGNEAWILQLLGVLCLSGDAPDLGKAETFSRQALALAAELGMEPLSAHSHLGLAMFYWKSGRRQEASCEKATAESGSSRTWTCLSGLSVNNPTSLKYRVTLAHNPAKFQSGQLEMTRRCTSNKRQVELETMESQ
jgi:ATP/maltotriose-dependent transcriptional regulator MalT